MRRIIYYFSGTGNSLRAAAVIGFVCPVYEWDIPGAFRSFIERLAVNPNAYLFMVATYIAVLGRSFETVEGLLREKGARLDYGRALRCVASQCIAYPPFPPERIMVPYMERQMERAGNEIARKERRAYPRMSPITRRRYEKVMGPYMAVEQEYDKGFFTDERCVGCGTCERVCPTRNIAMQAGRPVWNHRCHGCNACVAYCPTRAIQFRTPEAYRALGTMISKIMRLPEKRKRYHHPRIRAKDLMCDKKEIVPETR